MSLFEGLLDAISGAESGFIALVFVMPLENLNKLHAASPEGTTLAQVARGIYKSGGMTNFWNAWGPVASVVMTEKFGMFFFYSFLLSIYQRLLGGSAGFWPNLLIGYAADLLRLPFTYPLELSCVAVQASPKGTTMSSTMRHIVGTKGVSGLYAGASSYLGFAVRPAIQQTIYDQLKARLLPGGGELAFWTAFGFGAIGRFVAMIFAYPFLRAKIIAQAAQKKQELDEDDTQKESGGATTKAEKGQGGGSGIAGALLGMWRAGGVWGLYQGLPAELVRGLLFQAILMATKEKLDSFNQRLFNAPRLTS